MNLQELGFTKEEIQQRVVNQLVQQLTEEVSLDEDGETDEVGCDGRAHLRGRDVKARGHLRQRGRNNGGIESIHEESAGNDRGHDP